MFPWCKYFRCLQSYHQTDRCGAYFHWTLFVALLISEKRGVSYLLSERTPYRIFAIFHIDFHLDFQLVKFFFSFHWKINYKLSEQSVNSSIVPINICSLCNVFWRKQIMWCLQFIAIIRLWIQTSAPIHNRCEVSSVFTKDIKTNYSNLFVNTS